ncbi:MAG: polysaccharide deacetylase family protein, partial [Dehalobacter sp.]|nr:polysaccharide deacetylase family protein [Dehalobacter sp.]
MKNALSIDLENWYSNEFLLKYLPDDSLDTQVAEATDGLLKLMNKYDIKATFFILGNVAERYPELIKSIYEAGHEIGSHAYSHTTLPKLGPEEFEKELEQSTHLIKSLTGEQPIGFRAPSFSINQSTSWAFKSLAKYGYRYDSSIFPINAMLYGVPKAPLIPYRPSIDDITKHDPDGKIIEFPLSVIKSIINLPVSGGFYLRVLPAWFLDYSIHRINKDRPAILYIHPWETYSKTPRLKVPFHVQVEAYFGINGSLTKLDNLLEKHKFTSIRDVLNL